MPPSPDAPTRTSSAGARDSDAWLLADERRAHAPASAVTAAYLAATLLPYAVAATTGRLDAPRLGVHVALLAVAVWGARRRWSEGRTSLADALAAWAPLLMIAWLYTELPHLAAALGGAMHDAPVVRWERALFGESPARTLAARWPWPVLSEALHAGYLSYYALIMGPPLLFFAARRRRAFGLSAFAVMLTFACCYATYVLFPVQGPWFEWPAPAAIPPGPIRHGVEALLHGGSSRGTAFPSSHVAVSTAQTLVALRLDRRVGAACAVCAATLALGAVYGGLHYGIDVLAGGALGAALGLLAPRVYSRVLGGR